MKYTSKHKHLSTRIVKKFAWLPIRCKIWDRTDIRWLETVQIEQAWQAFDPYDIRVYLFGGYWENKRFI